MRFLFLSAFISFTLHGKVLVEEGKLLSHIESAPGIEGLRERLQSAQTLKGSLTRSFLPKVELTYGKERFTTGPYHSVTQPYGGIEAEVNLFNSGRDLLENRRRRAAADVAQTELLITKAQVLARARSALAEYAYLRELEAVLEDALVQNERNISGARKRISAGLSTKTDLLDFKQQRLSLRQSFERLKFEQGVNLRQLAVLLGISPEEEFSVKHENKHPEHTGAPDPAPAVANSLLTKRASLDLELAELDSQRAKLWWSPTLDLYGYAMRFTQKEREYDEPGERNDFTIGFKLTFPLFDGGEGWRESQARSALARSSASLAKRQVQEVEKETLDAVKKLELAHALIHSAEESVELMAQYRQGIMAEYSKGVKNSPDVLQANQRWIEAKTKFAEVKKDYQIARAQALYLMGLANE